MFIEIILRASMEIVNKLTQGAFTNQVKQFIPQLFWPAQSIVRSRGDAPCVERQRQASPPNPPPI